MFLERPLVQLDRWPRVRGRCETWIDLSVVLCPVLWPCLGFPADYLGARRAAPLLPGRSREPCHRAVLGTLCLWQRHSAAGLSLLLLLYNLHYCVAGNIWCLFTGLIKYELCNRVGSLWKRSPLGVLLKVDSQSNIRK